jgi:hyperosmotically inducible periplasmic protein
MKKALNLFLAAALAFGTASAFASSTSDLPGDNPRLEQRLYKEVHHALAMIPQVTIFDNLAYSVNGSTVTLYGEVRDAFIKDSAQSAVKHLEGVEQVDNKIEILPASFNDDRIRGQVARALFRDARLSRYAMNPTPPIRIIVKNGHVDLEGVVATQGDKDAAFIRANGVPGVFSVDNHLHVEQPKKG